MGEPALRLARFVMGTRFEIVLFGDPGPGLRATGEAALDEIEHWDQVLNLFRSDSFLSHLNREAGHKPVRVDGEFFSLLELCRTVHEQSGGAFDITVGSLMACWGFHGEQPGIPGRESLAEARTRVGFDRVVLDPVALTVRFTRPGLRLDFGAVAKGFALDLAAAILREEGVRSALLHGGTSTVVAVGAPPGARAWKVGVRDPDETVALVDEAFSLSAPSGRSFEVDRRTLGHLMDPASGRPAENAVQAAVACSSAARADAWSTAFCVAGPDRFADLAKKIDRGSVLLKWSDANGLRRACTGPLFKQESMEA